MYDISRRVQTIIVFRTVIIAPCNYSTHCMQYFCESFLHVFCLLYFVISVSGMKAQNRNTIFVNHIRINFTITIFSSQ